MITSIVITNIAKQVLSIVEAVLLKDLDLVKEIAIAKLEIRRSLDLLNHNNADDN